MYETKFWHSIRRQNKISTSDIKYRGQTCKVRMVVCPRSFVLDEGWDNRFTYNSDSVIWYDLNHFKGAGSYDLCAKPLLRLMYSAFETIIDSGRDRIASLEVIYRSNQ